MQEVKKKYLILAPLIGSMKEEFKRNAWFYIPYLFIASCCSIVLLISDKAETHIWLNQHQPVIFDNFFKYITILGDGVSLPFLLIVMLFLSFRNSLLITGSFLISGFIVQVFKHFIFFDSYRPAKDIEPIYHLRFIEGIHQYSYNSFPSGHATSAFVFFMCFALTLNQKHLKFVMLVCAALVAYSRVYLSQHFLVDILGGSLIGVLITFAGNLYLGKIHKAWLLDNLIILFMKK